MSYNLNELQRQFHGFLKTPTLWKDHSVLSLNQLYLPKRPISQFDEKEKLNTRLGKRVEQFVFSELDQHHNISILLKNTQIQKKKQTIGEIDCILVQDNNPIHLEIVYKFYLYDQTQGSTEIEHWIGPNRNDSLIKKLTKLRDKQLPLIHNPSTTKILSNLNVDYKKIIQHVYFKAQLFVPYNKKLPDFNLLNADCLSGYYIHYSRINQFKNCTFFIPNKIDWLIAPVNDVDWLDYISFYEKTVNLINKKMAPLCWIKSTKGIVRKFFVVWW
ncbi:DUF1853 family protein [Tamlana agarivorans]|uniref:DUF1853 family protein n=1 Tax=Pseudotamlana agarivorans TaxID=481183 RepID=A0ACC5UA48_9FLAO|nr:DUF1853 family protein [Tamlana agarivorans]MBU2951098.1 DUF1853 family protein [Tamlana agarivorans]